MGLIPDAEPMRERWARMHRWEDELLVRRAPDFRQSLEWLHGARELAARLDPDRGSREYAEAHWRHLTRIQQALARVRFNS